MQQEKHKGEPAGQHGNSSGACRYTWPLAALVSCLLSGQELSRTAPWGVLTYVWWRAATSAPLQPPCLLPPSPASFLHLVEQRSPSTGHWQSPTQHAGNRNGCMRGGFLSDSTGWMCRGRGGNPKGGVANAHARTQQENAIHHCAL